jgi:DNA-binding XRE family transcriptional regulator
MARAHFSQKLGGKFMSEKKIEYTLGQITMMTEESWRTVFSRRLWSRMETLDYSKADLSSITGISRAEIGNYLKGKNTPSAYNVIQLARALNMDVEELID